MKKKTQQSKRVQNLVLAVAVLVIVASVAFLLYSAWEQKQGRVDGSGVEYEESAAQTLSYQGKSWVYNDDLDHYLILGIDSTSNLSDNPDAKAGQSDAIYLISYNRREETTSVLAIPRDTMTQVEVLDASGKSMGSGLDHLSLQYAFGDGKHKSCELSRQAVSNLLLGLPIRGYAALNMESLSHLTELVGGVTLTVPDSSLSEVAPEFQEGAVVTLNAENTERFVRYRDINVSQSALVRQNRQIVFLKAFAERVRELQAENPSTITAVYNGLKSYMITNIGNDVFLKIASASGGDEIVTLPGSGSFNEDSGFDEYKVDEDALYDLIIHRFYKEAE